LAGVGKGTAGLIDEYIATGTFRDLEAAVRMW